MLSLSHLYPHGLACDFLASAATGRETFECMLNWLMLIGGICVLGVRAHRLSKKEKIAPPGSWLVPFAAVTGVLLGLAELLGWMK